jgi:hypothetical protein
MGADQMTTDTIAVIVGEMRAIIDPPSVGQVIEWADRLAALGDVEKDAARYRAMFSDGEWDYSDLWIGEQKSVVDAHIDRGLQPHEPEDD